MRPRQVEQAVPHKVKLPPFWEKDAAAWFKLEEAILEENRMRDPRVMYRTVLLHIPHQLLERARGVLGLADIETDPFKELKDRLVKLLTPSELDQCTSILWGAELGGQRSTELIEVMLASLPPGEQPGTLFKTVFLHRLLGDFKDLVAVQFQKLEAIELAMFADIIWDARSSKKAVVAAVRTAPAEKDTTPTEETALEKAGAALTILSKKRRQSRCSGGGGLCVRHAKFGEDAWHCNNPRTCSWMRNE